MTYKPHPLAELFPAMTGQEMTDLVSSIKAIGLLTPIMLYDGMILDGRHRYEACQMAGVKPSFKIFDGDNAEAFAIAVNFHRRSLSVSQRAMIAAKLSNMPNHRPAISPQDLRTSHAEAAKTLDVSTRSVESAARIISESPKLAKSVSDGKMSIYAAEKKMVPKPATPPDLLDKTGHPIPKPLLAFWQRGSEPVEAVHRLGVLRGLARQAQEEKDPLYNEVTFSALMAALDTAVMQFKGAVPYAVCPACNGINSKKCAQCRERGFISKFTWDQTVPAEIKAMREKAKK